MSELPKELARAALEIGAIKLQPKDPFEWASGYNMPIYNDNRMHLFHPTYRAMITTGLADLMFEQCDDALVFDVIAGTSTAGIPHAALLAHMHDMPMIYVRDRPKSHGRMNRIEGIDGDADLEGKRVLLIEDLISTGGSSASAVDGIRDAKGICTDCYSIFDYGFLEADKMFRGALPYTKKDKPVRRLDPPCEKRPILTYDVLMEAAEELGRFTKEELAMLKDWRADPWNWGENHGFPKK